MAHAGTQPERGELPRAVELPLYHRWYFRWRRAHEVPDPGCLSHGSADVDGAGEGVCDLGGRPLPLELSASLDGGLPGSRLPARRTGGGYTRLRPQQTE